MSRDRYSDACQAGRATFARAVAVADQLGRREWRVLGAVLLLTMGYSRTADRLSADRIAELAGYTPRTVSRALAVLHAAGVLTRSGGVGGARKAGTITLAPPPVGSETLATGGQGSTLATGGQGSTFHDAKNPGDRGSGNPGDRGSDTEKDSEETPRSPSESPSVDRARDTPPGGSAGGASRPESAEDEPAVCAPCPPEVRAKLDGLIERLPNRRRLVSPRPEVSAAALEAVEAMRERWPVFSWGEQGAPDTAARRYGLALLGVDDPAAIAAGVAAIVATDRTAPPPVPIVVAYCHAEAAGAGGAPGPPNRCPTCRELGLVADVVVDRRTGLASCVEGHRFAWRVA